MKAKQDFEFSTQNNEVAINKNGKILLLDKKAALELANGIKQCLLEVDGPKISVVVDNQTLKCRAKKTADNEVVVHINLGKFHLCTTSCPNELVSFLEEFTSSSFESADF
ncbi:hypothetical protein ACYSNM_06395 [Myroides sp. LJL116]